MMTSISKMATSLYFSILQVEFWKGEKVRMIWQSLKSSMKVFESISQQESNFQLLKRSAHNHHTSQITCCELMLIDNENSIHLGLFGLKQTKFKGNLATQSKRRDLLSWSSLFEEGG